MSTYFFMWWDIDRNNLNIWPKFKIHISVFFWTGTSDGIFERNFRGGIFGEGFFGLDFRAGEWPIDHVRIKTVFKMLTKVSSSRKTFKNRMSIEKTFIIFFQWKIRNIWNKNICVYFSCICLEKFYYKSQEIKIE